MAQKTRKATIPLRPLNIGIRQDTPSELLPKGALFSTEGAIITNTGVGRRLAFTKLAEIPGITGFRYINSYQKLDGSLLCVFVDSNGDFGVFDPIAGTTTYPSAGYSDATTLSGTSGSDTLVRSSGSWYDDSGLVSGDEITVSTETYTIISIDSDTNISVTPNLSATYAAETWSAKYKNILSDPKESIDAVQYLTDFVFTDNIRPPMYYDGSTIQPVVISARYRCKTLVVVNDRLYYGNINYIDNAPSSVISNPYMVTWASTVGDITSIEPQDNYLHIPYVRGEINKLTILGNLLVCGLSGGVMIGRQTQIAGSTLPYAFDKLETEERGVHNVNAFASALDGNFMLTTDNILRIGNDLTPQKIGTPLSSVLSSATNLTKSALLNAPQQSYLYAFLSLTSGADAYDTCVVLNTNTGAWGRFSTNFENFTIMDYSLGLRYSDISPDTLTYADLDPNLTYSALQVTTYAGYLIATKDNVIYASAIGGLTDADDTPIYFYMETGELDLNYPDKQKTFTRCSVRLGTVHEQDLQLTLEGSNDKGGTWYTLGLVTVPANQHEGYCNFIFTGPASRFRLSSTGSVADYIITEVAIDVKVRGLQYDNME